MSYVKEVLFCALPFAIGATWHFLGTWAGIPALLVFGIIWLGTTAELVQKGKV